MGHKKVLREKAKELHEKDSIIAELNSQLDKQSYRIKELERVIRLHDHTTRKLVLNARLSASKDIEENNKALRGEIKSLNLLIGELKKKNIVLSAKLTGYHNAARLVIHEELKEMKAQFFHRMFWPGTAYAEVAV